MPPQLVPEYVKRRFEHVIAERFWFGQQDFHGQQARGRGGKASYCLRRVHRFVSFLLADVCPRDPRPSQELSGELLVADHQFGAYLVLWRALEHLANAPPLGDECRII
jgi:hypothetical protein